MKPSQVINAMKTAIRANRPIFLHGSPGIGKSDMVRAVTNELGYELVDLRVSQLDPVDIRGLPTVDREQNRTLWTIPSYWPRKGVQTAIFFDELNSGSTSVMAACYQIILDRALGEHQLPEDTILIAAGNNMNDGGIVNVMPTPLKNRFVHIDVSVDDEEWAQWAVTHGVRSEVISLIRFKPSLLNEFGRVNLGSQNEEDKKEDKKRGKPVSHKDLKAFATPRTWKFVSDLMDANPDKSVAFALYAGTVGEGCAHELMSHIEVHSKLPDFNKIIKDPDRAPLPGDDEPAVMFSLATSLAAKSTTKNFDAILQYSKRMPPEFAIMLAKDAIMRDRQVATVAGFKEWAKQHSGIML